LKISTRQSQSLAFGLKPKQSGQNCNKLIFALGFAIFKAAGASNSEARTLSELISGGTAGRLLLEIAFDEGNHD